MDIPDGRAQAEHFANINGEVIRQPVAKRFLLSGCGLLDKIGSAQGCLNTPVSPVAASREVPQNIYWQEEGRGAVIVAC